MFRNYLHVAFRNLGKQKLFTFLNISGLSIGMAAALLVLLWVYDERSFDLFHSDVERIYRINVAFESGGATQTWDITPGPIAMHALKDVPEVEKAVRWTGDDSWIVKYGDKSFLEKEGVFVDSAFFEVFKTDFVEGNPAQPFPKLNSIVLTSSMAHKYFGKEPALGKVLMAEKKPMEVSAVIRDMPTNTLFQCDYLRNFEWLKAEYGGSDFWKTLESNYGDFNYTTMLKVRPDAHIAAIGEKLSLLQHANNKYDQTSRFVLQPLSEVHLYKPDGSDAGAQTLGIMTAVAALLILIACINYVNLATARAAQRAKEVGLRKVIGARRGQLFAQFLAESLLVFGISFALAVVCAKLMLPACNRIADKTMTLDWNNPQLLLLLGGIMLLTLVLAGIYPSLVLSSFNPLQVMKGQSLPNTGRTFFRKMLVTTQFVCSVALIINMLVVSRQMDFIRSKKLGYDKENVFMFSMSEEVGKNREAFVRALRDQPGVREVSAASSNIMKIGSSTGDTDWDGKAADFSLIVHPMSVEPNYLSMMHMELVAGQGFTGSKADSTAYILNEEAVKQAGIPAPAIGKRFKLWQTEGVIAGVVKDFHINSLRSKIQPVVLCSRPEWNRVVMVKTSGQEADKAIAAATQLWKQYESNYPIDYRFMDDSYDRMYKSEQRTGDLFKAFALIAILVSCLGLFGLAAYTAERRFREIGIRKVLGASVQSITGLLAMDFLKLVLLAIVIASPLAWYTMQQWLSNFAYRIEIQWWIFAAAGAIAVAIAFLTVGAQSLKAALANPAKSLRAE